MVTHPVSASFVMTLRRQAAWHGGSSQLRHIRGSITPSMNNRSTKTRLIRGFTAPSFATEQAIWHKRHPEQRSDCTKKVFWDIGLSFISDEMVRHRAANGPGFPVLAFRPCSNRGARSIRPDGTRTPGGPVSPPSEAPVCL